MKREFIVVLALLVAPVAAGAAASGDGRQAGSVIAEVNGRAITAADLDEKLAAVSGLRHTAPQETLAQINGLLRDEIDYLLSLEEFERRGYREDPRYTVPLKIITERKLANSFIRADFLPKAVPTDAEIAEKLPRSWTKLKLRGIYLPTLEEAQEVLAELEEGKQSFEQLREQRSMLTNAKAHGEELVLPGSGKYPQEFEDLLWALPQGGVSPVFDLGFMYAIVRVEERRETSQAEQDDYRFNVTLSLAEKKAGDAIARIQQGHTLEILEPQLQGAAEDVVAMRFSDPVVARIDGVEITYGDLVNTHPKPPESFLPRFSASMLVTDYRAFLRSIFAEWAAAAAARQAGYADPKAELAAKKAARSLITRRLGREIYKDILVSEKDVRDYYGANQQMFTKAEMFTLQTMEFSDRGKAEEAAAAAARNPDGFTKIREERSEEPFERRHGVDGQFKDDLSRLPAAVRDAVRAVPVGGVSGALERSGKFYVYKVVALEKQFLQPYESIKWPIYRMLLGERRSRAITEFIGGLRAAATMRIYEERLKAYAQAVGQR